MRPRPPLALSAAERDLLLGLLDSERLADVALATVFATLLDEGRYHGSIRTMYRLLAAQHQTGERRRQRIHPLYAVAPTRRPNAELRTREHLTPGEVEAMVEAAKANRWGHRDATMIARVSWPLLARA